MRISELPPALRELALRRQMECKDEDCNEDSDVLCDAFIWENTEEGHHFWSELDYHGQIVQEDDQIIM